LTDEFKVLYVLPKSNFFDAGRRGRVTHAIGVARGLSDAGASVSVVSGAGLSTYSDDLGERVHTISVQSHGDGPLAEGRWLMKLSRAIETWLRRNEPPWAVVIRYAVSRGPYIRWLLSRLRDVFTVLEVNSLAVHQHATWPAVVRWPLLVLEKRLMSAADLMQVVSEGLRRDMCGRPASISEDKVVTVPNAGTILPAMPKTGFTPETESCLRFTYMGVFQPYYELGLLMQAFDGVRRLVGDDAELHLYGDGPLSDELSRKAGPGVVLKGRYNLRELLSTADWYDRRRVLILPYGDNALARIGSPTKLFEYMAIGRPMLVSRIGQPADLLNDGLTAVFYEAGDIASLQRGMRWCHDNWDEAVEIGRRAREDFLQNHTWQQRMEWWLRTLRARHR
jgi:glycosyltransferase involved in cell wall biosynthesis